MNSFISTPIRCSLLLLVSALLVSGCSGTSNSNSAGSQSPVEMNGTDGNADDGNTTGANTMDDVGTTTDASGLEESSTTRVNFDITVPVYVSNALQVQLVWGDVDTTAMWNRDELWTASVDIPANTSNQLFVTFSDNIGAITLGSFETSFRTGTNLSETFRITADQFDTDNWDSDGDGVSNLSESIAGTYTQGSDALELVQPTLELVADKTFRISWQLSSDAQFYRVLENPDGNSGYIQISDDLGPSIQSYDHRVALYNRANARYIVQACDLSGCVDSDEQLVSGTLESAIGYFKAGSSDQGDNFGNTVSLSADGNTLAIGAHYEDGGSTGINGDQLDNSVLRSGAVYVFARINGSWLPQAYLKASNADEMDQFGGSLSLSADGNTLAIGSMEDSLATGIDSNQSDNSALRAGAVYVFTRINNNWQQHTYVKASNAGQYDGFGAAVSLSADGNTMAVGATGEDGIASGINGDQNNQGGNLNGAVYLFTHINGGWQQESYLKASNSDEEDVFGVSLSLSADGSTLVVGASGEASDASGINGNQTSNTLKSSGAVYVFVRVSGNWQQQAYVKASNPDGKNLSIDQSGDHFGESVSLSADGNTFVVGASGEDSSVTGVNGDQSDNSIFNAGAAYVFSRVNGNWEQQAYLKASNTGRRDWFGGAVSINADGSTVAIGAQREASITSGINADQSDNSADETGAVYLFTRTNGSWQQQAYMKANSTGTRDGFGGAVNLSADGNTLAVGAVAEDSAATDVDGDESDNSTVDSGAVYLY